MVNTYIVTIEDFKERANISNNLLTDRFKQESGIEQERFAIKILCDDLYNHVLSEVESGTFTPPITALMPYLKDYLVFKVYASYMVDGNLLATPAGFRTQNDTTSTLPTDVQMGAAVNKAKERANFYQNRLVGFLTKNSDDYSTWKDSPCYCVDNKVVGGNKVSKIKRSHGFVKVNMT